jgi:dTDP-4-amino-4,6-dideoxygalactose transaminase
MSAIIPFNHASLSGRELDYIAQTVAAGELAGDNTFTKRCNKLLEELLGVNRVLLTPSCTHALEMAALLLNIKEGDEVIVPSFTFVSTALAFFQRGAKIVFADVRPDTLNLDESKLEALVTPRTKVIVPVHYAGVACEMDEILAIAQKHGIAVVEDNAHGLFGKYRGRWLGTIGSMATQSFHATKNLTCGEGGALLVNNSVFSERAEIIREKGTDRSRFFRGQVDKYSWVDVGSSYLLSDVLAAFLSAQLEQWQEIQRRRKEIWDTYNQQLGDWAAVNRIQLPAVPEHCEQAYHMFYILLPSLADRKALIGHLKAGGIESVFHYLPLHLSKMGVQHGGKTGDCPVTEDVSDRLLRLPFFNSFTETAQARVIEAILEFRC